MASGAFERNGHSARRLHKDPQKSRRKKEINAACFETDSTHELEIGSTV